jgi:photosystem II stability/assembly factor-like uncharacterized protein
MTCDKIRGLVAAIALVLGLGLAGQAVASPFNAPMWGVINLPEGYPGTLYVWGGQLFGTQIGGIYVSYDAGVTWTELGAGLPNDHIRAFAISNADPEIMLANPEGQGIWRTTDGGQNWELVLPGVTVYHLEVDGIDPQLVLAGCEGRGIYRSLDFGLTWAEANEGLKGLNLTSIDVSPSDPNRIYVAFQGLNTGGIMVTEDGGGSWEDASPSTQRQNVVRVSPTDADTVIAGNDGPWSTLPYGIYTSTDGGLNWDNYWIGDDKDVILALHFQPDLTTRLLIGTQIWLDPWLPRMMSTDDLGPTITPYGGIPGTAETGIASIDSSPLDSCTIFGVGEMYLGLLRSDDCGDSWTVHELGIDEGNEDLRLSAVAVDPSDPQIVWAGGWGVYRSADGGLSWTTMATHDDDWGDVRSMAVRSNGDLLIGGWNTFHVSEDDGLSFQALADGLPDGGGLVDLSLATPDATSVYAAVSGNGAYRLDDGETAWVPIGPLGEDINRIVGRSAGQTAILAAASGDPYYSTDAGQTWQVAEVSGGTFFGPTSMARDPDEPGVALMGSIHGLYQSTDGGLTWALTEPSGLPADVSGGGIRFDPDDPAILLFASAGDFMNPGGAVYKSADSGASFEQVGSGIDPEQAGAITDFAFLEGATHKIWAAVGDGFGGTYGFHHSHDGALTFAEPAPYVDTVEFVEDTLSMPAGSSATAHVTAVNHVGEPAATPLESMVELEYFSGFEVGETVFAEAGTLDVPITADQWNGTYDLYVGCSGCLPTMTDHLPIQITGGDDPPPDGGPGNDAGDGGDGDGGGSSGCSCDVTGVGDRPSLLSVIVSLI